jgi:stage III sporulation protein SpoIIIAA
MFNIINELISNISVEQLKSLIILLVILYLSLLEEVMDKTNSIMILGKPNSGKTVYSAQLYGRLTRGVGATNYYT